MVDQCLENSDVFEMNQDTCTCMYVSEDDRDKI